MKKSRIWDFLTKREWHILANERAILLLVLIAPVIYLFFYGSIYRNDTVTKAAIVVIDRDQSEFSRLYCQYLEADPVLDCREQFDVGEAQSLLEQQKIAGYIILPAHLEENVKKGKQTTIPAYANAGSFILANELNKRFLQINQTLSTGVLLKSWQAKGLTREVALQQALPIQVVISSMGNFGYSYGNFLLVGLFILIIHQLMLISITESTALENEKGTISEWYAASGNHVLKALGGKILPYFLIFMVYYLFIPTFPFQSFHLEQHAHGMDLFLLGLPALLAVCELGVLLGSFMKTQLQALQFIALMSVPLFLVSGFSWPLEQMPFYLRWLNYLLPTHFLLLPFQSMTQLGSTLPEQLPSIMVLWIQVLIYFLLLEWRFSKVFRKAGSNVEKDINR